MYKVKKIVGLEQFLNVGFFVTGSSVIGIKPYFISFLKIFDILVVSSSFWSATLFCNILKFALLGPWLDTELYSVLTPFLIVYFLFWILEMVQLCCHIDFAYVLWYFWLFLHLWNWGFHTYFYAYNIGIFDVHNKEYISGHW